MKYLYVLRIKTLYYVGVTKDFKKRLSQHKSTLKSGQHQSANMIKDWLALGPDCINVVLVAPMPGEYDFFEALFAYAFKSYERKYGYNARFGGISSPEALAYSSELAYMRLPIAGFNYLPWVDKYAPMKDIYLKEMRRIDQRASSPTNTFIKLSDEFDRRLYELIGVDELKHEGSIRAILQGVSMEDNVKDIIRKRSGLEI